MRVFIVVVGLLLIVVSQAEATKALPSPRFRKSFSNNGKFFVESDPQKKSITVFDVNRPMEPIWSFQFHVERDICVLSDDGETVAIMWLPMRPTNTNPNAVALRFWNRKQGEFNTHSAKTVCKNIETARIGAAPFTFAADVRTWFVLPTRADGDSLRIKTSDNREIEFSFATGNLVSEKALPTPIADTCFILAVALLGGAIVGGVLLSFGGAWLVWQSLGKRTGITATDRSPGT